MASNGRKGSKRTSRTSSAASRKKEDSIAEGQVYLGPLLPAGSLRFFKVRRAGKYWGLSITCDICEYAPPSELLGTARWRNLAAHMRVKHAAS